MSDILQYLWFALIVGLIIWQAWLGLTVQELGIPGFATIKFGKSNPTPARDEFDLRLKQTDADIMWSSEVRLEIKAIIPSRRARFYLLDPVKPKFVPIRYPAEYSDRQQIAFYNAVQETFEIGAKGISRRYEIAPMDDGGADLHFAEMTVTDEYTSPRRSRALDVRFVQPGSGNTMARTTINGCRNDSFKIWTSCD